VPRFSCDTYDGDFFAPDNGGTIWRTPRLPNSQRKRLCPIWQRTNSQMVTSAIFIASVRDEAAPMVLRVALTLITEYPSQAQD
jgi:hypothetical protein